MRFLLELADGDLRLGGKARSLADLARRGLPTPPGFVIRDDLMRALCPELPPLQRLDAEALGRLDQARQCIGSAAWPAGFRDELHERLAALAARRFAVRSSFASEDRPGCLAAGVYESRVDLPAAQVEQAVRDVLRSSLAPGAVAYALAHGQLPAAGPLAVLVHAYVAGSAEGSAALAADPTATPLVTVRHGALPASSRHDIEKTLHGLRAAKGPVEVEWVYADSRVVYLQARPFASPPPPAVWAGWGDLGEDVNAQAVWRWDASHNPLPLSPAQRGLVELVDGRCSIGIRQRVLGGYLFYRKDDRLPPPAIPCETAAGFCASLRATIEARLAALGDPPGLEAALELFVSVYEPIFGVLQPALREAHRRLRELLESHAPAALPMVPAVRSSVPSKASERALLAHQIAVARDTANRDRALQEYLRQFGAEAPIWDVVAPTYAEAPDVLLERLPTSAPAPARDWREASAEVENLLDEGLHDTWRTLLALSRTAVALGEEDDWLYAQVQAAVRRALLALGKRVVADGGLADASDVFYLPLALARGLASGVTPPCDLAALADQGRKAWQDALAAPPPSPAQGDGTLVRGLGTGGRAVGRVRLHRPGQAQRPDAVLVAWTLLPAELPLLSAVALVTETGGLLDHVAAQARERGIPAVVSAAGATAKLADGDLVLVDGEHGLVVRMHRPAGAQDA